MAEWLNRNFDRAAEAARDIKDDIRHAIMGGWFGRNFEPHPTRQQPDLGWTLADRDKSNAPDSQTHEPTKPERERGIDR